MFKKNRIEVLVNVSVDWAVGIMKFNLERIFNFLHNIKLHFSNFYFAIN